MQCHHHWPTQRLPQVLFLHLLVLCPLLRLPDASKGAALSASCGRHHHHHSPVQKAVAHLEHLHC
jgi:hypothetical protein